MSEAACQKNKIKCKLLLTSVSFMDEDFLSSYCWPVVNLERAENSDAGAKEGSVSSSKVQCRYNYDFDGSHQHKPD